MQNEHTNNFFLMDIKIPENGILHGVSYGKDMQSISEELHMRNLVNRLVSGLKFVSSNIEERQNLLKTYQGYFKEIASFKKATKKEFVKNNQNPDFDYVKDATHGISATLLETIGKAIHEQARYDHFLMQKLLQDTRLVRPDSRFTDSKDASTLDINRIHMMFPQKDNSNFSQQNTEIKHKALKVNYNIPIPPYQKL